MSTIHYNVYPCSISLDPLRGIAQAFIFREQHIRITEAISLACCCGRRASHAIHRYSMSQNTVLFMIFNGITQTTHFLRIIKNLRHIIMRQVICFIFVISIKYVMFHIFVFSFIKFCYNSVYCFFLFTR